MRVADFDLSALICKGKAIACEELRVSWSTLHQSISAAQYCTRKRDNRQTWWFVDSRNKFMIHYLLVWTSAPRLLATASKTPVNLFHYIAELAEVFLLYLAVDARKISCIIIVIITIIIIVIIIYSSRWQQQLTVCDRTKKTLSIKMKNGIMRILYRPN